MKTKTKFLIGGGIAAAITTFFLMNKDDVKDGGTLPEVTIMPGAVLPMGNAPINTKVYTNAVKHQNIELWNSMKIKPEKLGEIDGIIKKIMQNKSRYEIVTMPFKIPWFVIAIKHWLEGSGNFERHVHNGDPLTARTVNVPNNPRRPIAPPANGIKYTWEESAIDAMVFTEMHKHTDWSIPHMLWIAERYNGLGYRRSHSMHSAYIWSFTNHYTKGKYSFDNVFDPNLVSKQPGFACVLKRMIDKGHIKSPSLTA